LGKRTFQALESFLVNERRARLIYPKLMAREKISAREKKNSRLGKGKTYEANSKI
jgi:hypothetical protein